MNRQQVPEDVSPSVPNAGVSQIVLQFENIQGHWHYTRYIEASRPGRRDRGRAPESPTRVWWPWAFPRSALADENTALASWTCGRPDTGIRGTQLGPWGVGAGRRFGSTRQARSTLGCGKHHGAWPGTAAGPSEAKQARCTGLGFDFLTRFSYTHNLSCLS